jgi:hypothetical protein
MVYGILKILPFFFQENYENNMLNIGFKITNINVCYLNYDTYEFRLCLVSLYTYDS